MEQGSYKTWKALNILEFVKKYLKVFGYFLKLFDIQNGRFVELILHVHIWPNCLKLIWKIQCQILLISNPFSSVFSPWMIHDLECPWIWLLMIYCDHRNVDGVTGTTEYFDKIQNNRYFQNAFNFRSIYCFVDGVNEAYGCCKFITFDMLRKCMQACLCPSLYLTNL